MAILGTFIAIGLALSYTSKHIPSVGYYIAGGFILAFLIEIFLRLFTKRVVRKQTKESIIDKLEDEVKHVIGGK